MNKELKKVKGGDSISRKDKVKIKAFLGLQSSDRLSKKEFDDGFLAFNRRVRRRNNIRLDGFDIFSGFFESIEKQQKPKRKRKRAATILFRYRYLDEGFEQQAYETRKLIIRDADDALNKIENIVKRKFDIDNQDSGPILEDTEFLTGRIEKITYDSSKKKKNILLTNLMFKSNVKVEGLGQGSCVYEFLEKNTEIPRFKIDKLFDNKKGLSVIDIDYFCFTYKYNYTMFNLAQNLIQQEKYNVSQNSRKKMLMFYNANNHCYPITNTFERKSVIALNRDVIATNNKISNIKNLKDKEINWVEILEEDADINVEGIFVIKDRNLDRILNFYMVEKQIIPIVKIVSGHYTYVQYENTTFIYNKLLDNCLAVYNICKKFDEKIQFNPSNGIGTYIIKHFNNEFPKFKKSHYNSDTINITLGCVAFYDTFNENYNENSKALDFNRHYTNVFLNNEYDFPIYSPNDHPEICTKYIGEAGYYYLECDHKYSMGNNWYCQGYVEYLIKAKISFSMKQKWIPKECYKHDYFNKYIDTIKSIKNVTNAFIGTLNMKGGKVSRKNSYFIDNVEERDYYINLCYSVGLTTNVRDGPVENTWIIQPENIIHDSGDSSPIYSMIVQMGRVANLEFIDTLPKSVVVNYIKTDCVGITGELKDVPDNMKIEKFKMPLYKREILGFDAFEINIPEWDIKKIKTIDSLPKKSGLYIGDAGCGKSKNITNIEEWLIAAKLKYKILAFTNTAALNVGGQTIDTGLVQGSRLDYIIVDEIGMVSSHYYTLLNNYKMRNPDIIFLFFGDLEKQLKPIERVKYDYFNSVNLKLLFDGNCFELYHNYRYSKSDKILMEKVFKGEPKISKKLTKINIVKTNNERIKINKMCMDYFVKDTNRYFETEIELLDKCLEGICCKNNPTQKCKINVGTPIISRHSNRNLKLINNGISFVESIDFKNKTFETKNKEDCIIKIKFEDFNKSFLVNYAMTISKKQGATITDIYTIWNFKKMDKYAKWTALTRAVKYDNIIFSNISYDKKVKCGVCDNRDIDTIMI